MNETSSLGRDVLSYFFSMDYCERVNFFLTHIMSVSPLKIGRGVVK